MAIETRRAALPGGPLSQEDWLSTAHSSLAPPRRQDRAACSRIEHAIVRKVNGDDAA
jgi:hypothetical protein